MAHSAERAFWKALQTRAFEPVYYFFGDDEYLKEQAIRQLIAAAVDPATRDFNLDLRRGGELDAEAVGSLLGTPPMMADRRVVVVRDVGALKKEARAALDGYVAAPAPDVVLVLTSPGGEKGKPDKALQAKAAPVEFAPLSADRVPKWIVHHVTTELQTTITPEAVELLQSAVGTDLPTLVAELDKLASYASGGAIDEAAVTAIVGVRREQTLGAFLDRVAAHDAAAALAMIPQLLMQPKLAAVPIVMALTTQTLALAWGRARRDAGVPAFRLEGEFFNLLKEGSSAFTGRPWGEAVKAWARAVDHWSAPALDRALDALLATDAALKESRLSSDEQVLANLVLSLCVPGARRAA